MSPRRRGRKKSGRGRGNAPQPLELWKAVPEPPPAEPILPQGDPGAILRSLGSPPLTGHANEADQALQLVAYKASATATALAKAAGLLVDPEDEDLY